MEIRELCLFGISSPKDESDYALKSRIREGKSATSGPRKASRDVVEKHYRERGRAGVIERRKRKGEREVGWVREMRLERLETR